MEQSAQLQDPSPTQTEEEKVAEKEGELNRPRRFQSPHGHQKDGTARSSAEQQTLPLVRSQTRDQNWHRQLWASQVDTPQSMTKAYLSKQLTKIGRPLHLLDGTYSASW